MDGGTVFTMKWAKPILNLHALGLKTKITFLIVLIVAGVLFLSGYLDFQLAKKAHFDLYLDRNLYIAKQIDIAIPDQKMMENLPYMYDEIEEWLLSRPSLTEIDVFLFKGKEYEVIVSNSKGSPQTPLVLSNAQVNDLKKDRHLSSLRDIEAEKWLEVVVPLHVGPKVVGGIRVVGSLDEAQSYLSRKRDRTILITLSSILVILVTLTLLFRKLVGNPIQILVDAMARAENGRSRRRSPPAKPGRAGQIGAKL